MIALKHRLWVIFHLSRTFGHKLEAQSPGTPNPLHVLIRFWQTVPSHPRRIISQYPLSYLHSKVLPLWLHCKKICFFKYWVLLDIVSVNGRRTTRAASVYQCKCFYGNRRRILSQWCSLFMCWETIQPAVLAAPQGGAIRASWSIFLLALFNLFYPLFGRFTINSNAPACSNT